MPLARPVKPREPELRRQAERWAELAALPKALPYSGLRHLIAPSLL